MAGILDDILSPFIGEDNSAEQDALMQQQLQAYRDLVLGNRPEQLQVGQSYNPQGYSYSDANYQTVNEDPALKAKQMASLGQLDKLSNQGLSEQDRYVLGQAAQNADAQASAQQASIRDMMSRRGQSGGGQELAMQLQAQQQESNRAANAGAQQAALAAQQKEAYRQAYMQGLGQQRQQDYNVNAGNADIINRFNAANTQGRNAYNQDIAKQQNLAQMYNIQQPNTVAQQNIANTAQWMNQAGEGYGGAAKGYAAQSAAEKANRNKWLDLIAKGATAAATGGKT